MLQMTVFYIIYLGYASLFKTAGSKLLEIVNESVFVIIQYLLMLLHSMVWVEGHRNSVGTGIIVLTSLLLAMNFIIIIMVSLRPQSRKFYLNRLRKQAIAKR